MPSSGLAFCRGAHNPYVSPFESPIHAPWSKSTKNLESSVWTSLIYRSICRHSIYPWTNPGTVYVSSLSLIPERVILNHITGCSSGRLWGAIARWFDKLSADNHVAWWLEAVWDGGWGCPIMCFSGRRVNCKGWRDRICDMTASISILFSFWFEAIKMS